MGTTSACSAEDATDSETIWPHPTHHTTGKSSLTISAKPVGVSALDCEGRTIWIVDAHPDDGKRFVVHADETLTPFLELESTIRADARERKDCVKTAN